MESHVLHAQRAMMVFRTKKKLALTVEDHVTRVNLAMMVFRIKEKPLLIVEDHVLCAKVEGQGPNDICITSDLSTIMTDS